jgi:hypothetical protein
MDAEKAGAYPGGMHRMHVHPPSPPCASPPPAMCIPPPPQPERLVKGKDETVGNKKKMQVCLPKHNYRQTPIFRHPFFRKQCFSLNMFWEPPLKIFGGMSKFRLYVKMKSSLQFEQCKGPKKATFLQCRSYLHFAKLRHTEGFTNVNAFI